MELYLEICKLGKFPGFLNNNKTQNYIAYRLLIFEAFYILGETIFEQNIWMQNCKIENEMIISVIVAKKILIWIHYCILVSIYIIKFYFCLIFIMIFYYWNKVLFLVGYTDSVTASFDGLFLEQDVTSSLKGREIWVKSCRHYFCSSLIKIYFSDENRRRKLRVAVKRTVLALFPLHEF